MTAAKFDPARYADQAAVAIGLPLDAAHRPGVIENLARIHTIATPMLEFPLPDDVEPAPKFEP